MSNDTTAYPAATPGREGSDEACLILRLLHRYPEGMSSAGIVTVTGLMPTAVQAALLGLQTRNRITPRGRGTASRWFLCAHAPAESAAP